LPAHYPKTFSKKATVLYSRAPECILRGEDGMTASQKTSSHMNARAQTGISGLDDILFGGLPSRHLYLVEGDPGTGKTTLALQFLLEGLKRGEKGLYVTLSESKAELLGVAESH